MNTTARKRRRSKNTMKVVELGVVVIAGIFLAVLLVAGISLVFAVPFWWLVNYIHLSFLPHLSFLRAWAAFTLIIWLASLLGGARAQ